MGWECTRRAISELSQNIDKCSARDNEDSSGGILIGNYNLFLFLSLSFSFSLSLSLSLFFSLSLSFSIYLSSLSMYNPG